MEIDEIGVKGKLDRPLSGEVIVKKVKGGDGYVILVYAKGHMPNIPPNTIHRHPTLDATRKAMGHLKVSKWEKGE